ncbi:MAG: FapA family protein [Oscillospiraceae bacterium]|nr:FapA family protein [Oscillospiraceae bacterium]
MSGQLIRLYITDDKMQAYIIMEKTEIDIPPPTEEDIRNMLSKANISWGIDESALRLLIEHPPEEGKVLVAGGTPPVEGKDGYIQYFVTRTDEYKPNYSNDENALIDYKNIDAFQLVAKGQELCRQYPPVNGSDGVNVFGVVVPARKVTEAALPIGNNTEFSDDGLALVASVGGSIHFNGSVINIKDVLRISGDVNMASGNVRFEGDVFVEGSVNEGFIVECGGNLTIRGRITNAEIRVKNNLVVGEGLTGAKKSPVTVGGFLKCRYIESSVIRVQGDIFSDYIIDSDVECRGDITLAGRKALLVGGRTCVLGLLSTSYIGNAREIRTRLELMENPFNKERLTAIAEERDHTKQKINTHKENISKLRDMGAVSNTTELDLLHKQLTEQLRLMTGRLFELESELRNLRIEEAEQYPGIIRCSKIMFPGADVYAGSLMMPRDHSKLEHCKIHLGNGNWVKGLA